MKLFSNSSIYIHVIINTDVQFLEISVASSVIELANRKMYHLPAITREYTSITIGYITHLS